MHQSTENLIQIESTTASISTYEYYQDGEILRPCFLLLRILGVWQPRNSWLIWKIYTKFVWVLWLGIVVAIFLLNYFQRHEFRTETVLNNICTIVDFCSPLLFLRYYFKFGNYKALVSHVHKISDENAVKSMKKIRYVYTIISVVMWIAMTTFFIFHWKPFWKGKWWLYLLYITVLVYTMGWWSVWFTLYGFVCHVHHREILMYRKHINEVFNSGGNDDYNSSEKSKIGHLLFQFNELETKLHRTQRDFSKIISIAVAYHIIDMFFFSLAYFKNDFVENYPIWQYCGTIFYDLVSILIKLYPAAIVCQSLHKTVVFVGDMCTLGPNKSIPYARFNFFSHLSYREQDMGLRILGVKITLQITVGIFVTVGTALVGFLRLLTSE